MSTQTANQGGGSDVPGSCPDAPSGWRLDRGGLCDYRTDLALESKDDDGVVRQGVFEKDNPAAAAATLDKVDDPQTVYAAVEGQSCKDPAITVEEQNSSRLRLRIARVDCTDSSLGAVVWVAAVDAQSGFFHLVGSRNYCESWSDRGLPCNDPVYEPLRSEIDALVESDLGKVQTFAEGI